MAKLAKTILKHSIEDIETTHWCKEDLYLLRVDKDGKPIKQMGCALGLLAMNGEHGKPFKANGKRWFRPWLPSRGEPSPGFMEAVRAVFNAIPNKPEWCNDENELYDLVDAIACWNDDPKTTRAKVKSVFKKALASL